MDRDLLAHLPVFLAVSRHGGFASAAAKLGMSPSAVSHSVRVVEDGLGTTLFARTTRSVALTEAGRSLQSLIGSAFGDIAEALESVRATSGAVTGTLRLNASRTALTIAVTPIIEELALRHPDLRVEVVSEDASIDIIAKGFDAGVRLGEMIAQDMVAVRLTDPFAPVLVASPAYLGRRGEPADIAGLAGHNCIGYRQLAAGGLYDWELRDGGTTVAVKTSGTPIVTDSTYARELALTGVGIAYIFEPLVAGDIAAGRLRRLLPQASIEEPGLFLYYPRRAALAPKLRAFIDVAAGVLAGRRRLGRP